MIHYFYNLQSVFYGIFTYDETLVLCEFMVAESNDTSVELRFISSNFGPYDEIIQANTYYNLRS